MNIQPYYPSNLLVIDSDRKISGNPVDFKVELDSSFDVSEGNFYCRLINVCIEQADKPGIPYSMRGLIGVQSSIANGNFVIGCKRQNECGGLQNIIGCFMNKSDKCNLEYLGNLQTSEPAFDYGRTTSEICNSWFPIKAPAGVCDFKLVDSEGTVWNESYPEVAITELGTGNNFVNAFTETILNVSMVFEIKQVKPLDETKAQLKVSRPYLPI